MKAIVRSAEPENERRRSLIQSNTGFVGLRDFLLDGAGRTASAALRSICIEGSSDASFGNGRADVRSTVSCNGRRSRRSYKCADSALRTRGAVGSDIRPNDPPKPSGALVHSSPGLAAYA
jgi:hypothetical protein